MNGQPVHMPSFQLVCALSDLVPLSGTAALCGGDQVALFYLPETEEQVFAIGNYDPIGEANVMSRGIVGDVGGVWAVASPLYKQHFCLTSGVCIEKPEYTVPVYPVRIDGQLVSIGQVQRQ